MKFVILYGALLFFYSKLYFLFSQINFYEPISLALFPVVETNFEVSRRVLVFPTFLNVMMYF